MQNFGRENFDDSTCICQIRHTFPPSKFYAIRYLFIQHTNDPKFQIITETLPNCKPINNTQHIAMHILVTFQCAKVL